MALPTEPEYKLLEKFRQNILDLQLTERQLTDMFLLTWIRARDNDLVKAEDMLRKSIKWRAANEMDSIFSWSPPQNYQSEFPFDLVGLDNEGRPVVILCLGIWNIRGRVDAGEKSTYIRYVDQVLAKIVRAIEDVNREQFVIILDMKGFSLKQLTSPSNVETMLETFRRFEANYPERLCTSYCINAPRIFPIAFALVKPLLSGRTLQKIQIYNSNAEKWKPVLRSAIPKETLPTKYGGTNSKCNNDIVNQAAESFNGNETGLVETTIRAGGKLELDFHIDTPNSILRWDFETVDYDIGHVVIFDTMEVCPYARLNSHLGKEKGQLVCEKTGKYIIVFDNTHSRLRSKTLRYMVSVEEEQING